MIKCPNCGASHYSEGPSMRTAVYYPPVWKDGVNTNPDRNTTTTKAHCLECNFDFEIKEQNGKTWTILKSYNPPPPKSDIDITAKTEQVPIDVMSSGTAIIDIDTGAVMRDKYQWEKDIEYLQERVQKIQNDVTHLAGEIVKINTRIGDLVTAIRVAIETLR